MAEQEEVWEDDPISLESATGKHIQTHNWRGDYNFHLSHSKPAWENMDNPSLKTMSNTWVSLTFETKSSVKKNFFLRALPFYVSPWETSKPLIPCKNHSQTIFGMPMRPNNGHFLIVKGNDVIYEEHKSSGRRSCIIPISVGLPQTIHVKCMDFLRCPEGINKRDIAAVFTIETKQEVLGRAIIGIQLSH